VLLNSITTTNALANLATNGKGASLKLSGSAVLNTGTAFANAGKVTLTKGSKFTIGGRYTQTVSGMTQVDGPGPLASAGTIAATSFVLNGGTLQGAGGFINAPVTANATVIAGDSKTKTGTLNVASYTQGASGILDIQITGTTSSTCSLTGAGTTFSLLNSQNGIALDGTLKVNVIGTTLHSGDCYVIATGTAVSGDFATKPAGFTVKIATAATPPQVQLIVN
jgi:hypothetical protein